MVLRRNGSVQYDTNTRLAEPLERGGGGGEGEGSDQYVSPLPSSSQAATDFCGWSTHPRFLRRTSQ